MTAAAERFTSLPDSLSTFRLGGTAGAASSLEGKAHLLSAHQVFGEMRDPSKASRARNKVMSAHRAVYCKEGASATQTDAYQVFDKIPKACVAADVNKGKVLSVTVHQMLYPITVSVLHQVFGVYGVVLNLRVIGKLGWCEVLVQYDTCEGAAQAMDCLQGRCIYDGCCRLDIKSVEQSEMEKPSVNTTTKQVPKFDGTNMTKWRAGCEEFFELYKIPQVMWIIAAEMNMIGDAALLLQAHKTKHLIESWEDLCAVMLHAFGPGTDQKVLDSGEERHDINDNKTLNAQSATSQDSMYSQIQASQMHCPISKKDANELQDNDIMTHVGGLSLFLEFCSNSADEMFNDNPLKNFVLSTEIPEDVVTDVGGMSLFLELGLDSKDDKFAEMPFKDIACNKELAGSPLIHVGGVSLFRELILAATQPSCRCAFIPGFEEQRHMMKNYAEWCEQWDPGILVEKAIRLTLGDVDRTKRLFLGSTFQILEAICSERPSPWPSWRCYGCGELLGFQSNGSIHALGDARKGTWVALWPLPCSWCMCYLTGARLKRPPAEMKIFSEKQLLEVKACRHDFDKAEIAYNIHGLDLPHGGVVRRLRSRTWLLSYHGVVVHTCYQLSRALKYKIRTLQQKHGGIDISSGCKDFILLLGWMDVRMVNTCWLHLIPSWKPPQLILLCCVATHIWEQRGVVNVGAKYSQHIGRTIVSLLDNEQNTIVLGLIPELILSLQGLHGLVISISCEPQGVYWITIMSVVTCVEVLDAHIQWDPGGFLSTMSGEHELARQIQCRGGSDKQLRPEHAIAWGQAMFCRGGSVTPGVPLGYTRGMGCRGGLGPTDQAFERG